MDSEAEESEVRNHFPWLTTSREVVAVPKNEAVSKNVAAASKDSICRTSDESLIGGEGVSSTSNTEFVPSAVTNFEISAEDGVVPGGKPFLNPVFDVGNSKTSSEAIKDSIEITGRENIEYLPPINVPEKIILCFDLSEDHFYLSSNFNEVNDKSTLNVIKQAIEMFIHSKHMIDKRHEFSLVVVHQKAVWLQDFTNNLKDILPVLSELTEAPPSNSFCLTSLFDVIKENVTLPIVEDSANIPPPYLIRPIIIYSRCQCVPKFNDGRESFHNLMSSKYFGFDYIVIHESLSPESSQSDDIAKVFEEMCTKPWSSKFHVSRSATKVLDSMAKLLSHPLQRGKVRDFKVVGETFCLVDSNGVQ